MTLSWYIKRLHAMSLREVLFRIRVALRKRLWRIMLKSGRAYGMPSGGLSSTDFSQSGQPLDLSALSVNGEARDLIKEAEVYLRHEWRFWGRTDCSEGPIDWHLDPSTGRRAPAVFGFDINHRDGDSVGDIKWIWEKNRHHHLTVLALAYALTGEERFAAEVESQLQSWIEQNPPLIGVNWTHPLEHGIRLISWAWCERLLRRSPAHERLFGEGRVLWSSIHAHQKFIADMYCRGSSANNHLIGEMAGLYIASCAFPVFEASDGWRMLAKKILEEELSRQTFPSGLNREMAFPYHLFVFEFAIAAYAEGQRAQDTFSPQFVETLRRMIEAVPSLTDMGGNLPRYGDSDEGRAVQLQASSASRDAWLYHVSRPLLGASEPPTDEGQLASGVLLAGLQITGQSAGSDRSVGSVGSVGYEDAGIYVLASSRGTPEEVFVTADAGPLGFLSIAAHGHADALSFTLSAGGRAFFVDPGTFDYYSQPKWRRYFRSVFAHNTLVVDGEDQSVQEGAMMWGRRAEAGVSRWEPDDSGGILEASHDGYRGVGITHRRRLRLAGSHLEIVDAVEGQKFHDLQLRFHLHPDCRIDGCAARSVRVRREQINVEITLPETVKLRIVRGGADAGWYSPAYSVRQEATTLIGEVRGELPLELLTSVEAHC